MNVPHLRPPVTHWVCERCPAQDATQQAGPHTRFHRCAALGGAEIPMVVRGARSRVVLREREDYVNGERVQLIAVEDGKPRPIMSAVTEHADGSNDAVIFAPAAARGFA